MRIIHEESFLDVVATDSAETMRARYIYREMKIH